MKKRKIIFLLILTFLVPIIVYASQGCCSHHGGMDYCDRDVGKWVCEDGTYSPTCTCRKTNDNNEENIITEKNDTIEKNEKSSVGLIFLVLVVSIIIVVNIYIKVKNKRCGSMIKKVLYFHNIFLPFIVFMICLSSLFSYGFTIKGLINLIVMIYSIIIIWFADIYHERLLKKMKELRNEKVQSSNIHKSIH